MDESLWTQPTAEEVTAFDVEFNWALTEIDQLREQMRKDALEIKLAHARCESHLTGIDAILKELAADCRTDDDELAALRFENARLRSERRTSPSGGELDPIGIWRPASSSTPP